MLDSFLEKQFNPFDFYIGVSGGARNLIGVLKASMSLPVIYREFPVVDGRTMTDGGFVDNSQKRVKKY